ncbi:MAG: hypothetical protein M3144_13285 [Actinomycetota bacterium]|nr:hypothetical protein [Actinomycetota bacterium]
MLSPGRASSGQPRIAIRGSRQPGIETPGFNAGRRKTRGGLAVATLILLSLTLTACSSGSARESERAQEAASSEEAVLPERQATFTAQFVAQATPTKVPAPPPSLASIVLTTQVGGDGSPSGEYESVPTNAGTVYIAAQLTGVKKGQVVRAVVRDPGPGKNILLYGDVTVSADGGTVWVAVPLQMNGSLAPGDYPVWIVIDPDGKKPEWIDSLVFTVTSAGNSPQQVSSGSRSQQSDEGEGSDPLHPEGSSGGGSDDGDGDSPPIQPRDGQSEDE